MKTAILLAAGLVLSTPAFAQSAAKTEKLTKATVETSIENSIERDLQLALEAFQKNDHDKANALIQSVSLQSSRLNRQKLTDRLAVAAPTFSPDETQFTLASSSTLAFENLINQRETVERRFLDDKGRVVTVRVFDEGRDLSNFQFIADTPEKLSENGLERAVMRGEVALKKPSKDGALSVLMMSEKDHALIEVEGDDMDVVMAFISDLENDEN